MNKNSLRDKIFELVDYVDFTGDGKRDFDWYDVLMLITIIVSMIPLLFKQQYSIFYWFDIVTVTIFIIDYILRWITSDLRQKRTGVFPFLIHPFTPNAIIDLIAILPSFSIFSDAWRVLRMFRILKTIRIVRTLKIFRIAKVMRYSSSYEIIVGVLKNSWRPLIAVFNLALGYIIVSALIIFNVEPDAFNNFFDAVYWATISLTTVGYGDIYPVTTIGRLVAMVSSIFGIAIVALPAGIITAGYMEEVRRKHGRKSTKKESENN